MLLRKWFVTTVQECEVSCAEMRGSSNLKSHHDNCYGTYGNMEVVRAKGSAERELPRNEAINAHTNEHENTLVSRTQ